MKIINLEVYCINCGEPIQKPLGNLDNEYTVNVDIFSQSDWECDKCGHTTVFGDIECMDLNDF